MATIVSDSSSDENRGVSPDKTSGRQRKLEFVWMATRLVHTPRGNAWIALNRDGRVKEISFTDSQNSQQMKELIRKNFTKLAQADFSRIRFYKSANRGNDLERFTEHRVPSGKEFSKIYTASASKRVYFRFGKDANADTNRSSTRQNNSATVTTVPSTVAASNNVVSPVMSADVVPSSVAVSTSVASCFVTTAGTPVSTGAFYSPTTSHASAATAIFGNQVMSYQDWEKAGTIINELDPMGLLETNGDEDENVKEDNRLTETLYCEKILRRSQAALPVFLNLSFEEICYQALQDRKVIVATVIVKDDNNGGTLARLLSEIENNDQVYFWIAKATSVSGKQVKSKFGTSGGSEMFVLSPTLAVTNPVLVHRFSGDSLRDDAHACNKSIQEAIERGKHALTPMLAEWDVLEEERTLKRHQDEELQESVNEDRRKRVATERKKRVDAEPSENFWEISVQLPDDTRVNRKFPRGGNYQQVYDWIGTVQPETDFTLHRVGSGFIREACQHNQKLTESEVLVLIVRSESGAEDMLQNEVSFIGNYTISNQAGRFDKTKDDEEQSESKVQDSVAETGGQQKKKKIRKRRKRNKNIQPTQEEDKEKE